MLAGILATGAYIIYIVHIFQGKTKPNKTTWWIWSFMGGVIGLSYYFSGARNTIWVPFVEFLGPLIIAILSLKYGEWRFKDRSDIFCLLGGFLSILLWIIFDNSVVALVSCLFVDSFAILPTVKKSYSRPEEEDFWAWFITMVANTLNLFSIEKFTFGIVIYPIYILLLDAIIFFLLLYGKVKKLTLSDKS